MTTEPPPPPEDDPFKKRQPPPGEGGGSPYGTPSEGPEGSEGGATTPPPYAGDPYGGGPYGNEPLAGMPPLGDSPKRVLARILDMILVGAVSWLLAWAFGATDYGTDNGTVQYSESLGQSVIAAVLYVAYDTVLTARDGQTLGKKLFRMRVANLNDGSTPSWQNSLTRALVLWLPFAFCCACVWTAITGGWSFFDKPYKQGLHDKPAKTVVVSTG
ncbi:RDD family protein [Streptomyces ureilyticus]|uniref:RDD family protein n=1 Tax=Streptomyces ureilyticus TaxID=1775131 RepID=A0ABX0DRT8_9ACTN|nr:RDD family protein [Streptomyces ureilyticus]NGO44608.1 RDD family protein [Streptomyces ureilyticus]